MHEQVGSASLRSDESVALIGIEPLDGTSWHPLAYHTTNGAPDPVGECTAQNAAIVARTQMLHPPYAAGVDDQDMTSAERGTPSTS